MARPLVSDELCELIEPVDPKGKRRYRYPGRRRIDDRKVLTGIPFVLRTGIPDGTVAALSSLRDLEGPPWPCRRLASPPG